MSREEFLMFETGQPTMKSNRLTIAVVLGIVLAILLSATWYFTRR
jgi:hypothetical protein